MLRDFALNIIAKNGRLKGAPGVIFTDEIFSVPGEDIRVATYTWSALFGVRAFYLPLPPNTFGIVTFPDGTNKNMNGGVHIAQPGLYKLQYIDKKEREALSALGGNITSSGEKITLKMLFRYRVIEPIALLRISNPVGTLINHINTGIPRYIGSRKISEIADNPNNPRSKLHSFFQQWLSRHHQLSKAFMLTSFDIKNFDGDKEYLELRRNAALETRKNEIAKKRENEKQGLERELAKYRIAKEESDAKFKKTVTKNNAEIERIKAEYEDKTQKIRQEIESREIGLENKRNYLQRRDNQFIKVFETISNNVTNGQQLPHLAIKNIADLVAALKEGTYNETNTASEPEKGGSASSNNNQNFDFTSTSQNDKIDNLTNTLLNLLDPKK